LDEQAKALLTLSEALFRTIPNRNIFNG